MRRLLAAPLSALLLLAGCGSDPEVTDAASTGAATSSAAAGSSAGSTAPDGTDPASAPVTTASGTGPSADTGADPDRGADGASDAAPFPADTDPDTGQAQPGEGPTVVRALRIGTHEGFDRVVFEVTGSAVPGWDVGYADAPTQAGSGRPIDVPGEAFLRVSLTGITNPFEAPGIDELDRGTTTSRTGVVAGVGYDSVYEGQALAYVGVATRTPFRVYALTNPARVVVEVTG